MGEAAARVQSGCSDLPSRSGDLKGASRRWFPVLCTRLMSSGGKASKNFLFIYLFIECH